MTTKEDKCQNCECYTEIMAKGLCEGCFTSKVEVESQGGYFYE